MGTCSFKPLEDLTFISERRSPHLYVVKLCVSSGGEWLAIQLASAPTREDATQIRQHYQANRLEPRVLAGWAAILAAP